MPSDRPDPEQTARRVRAAMGYAKVRRRDLADALGVHPSVLDEITGARSKLRGASWEELRTIARRCGVPFTWFWADFDRLDEIAPVDRAPALFNAGRSSVAERDPVAAGLGIADRAARDLSGQGTPTGRRSPSRVRRGRER